LALPLGSTINKPIEVGACHQGDVPPTPVTPVSAKDLVSLQNLIKQDAHTLDETSIPRLERRVQKLVDAAQVSIAECALLRDEKQKLTRMANEAKVRRSTKSLVLGQGQGKVMSFADIEEARAARAAKDDKKGKGKCGRKRKSAALEADEPEAAEAEVEPEPEPEPEVARAAKEVVKGKKRGRKRKIAAQEAEESEPEVARMIDVRVPWRAPVARMI
ncbi:hypothetical protein LARI1_G009147, partial [Lachnellula arida]